MRWRVGVAVLVLLGLLAVGLVIVWVARGRVDQDRVYCQNNLRVLGQATETSGLDLPPGVLAGPWVPALAPNVPPGTVPNPALPPERRLSWVVPELMLFDQRRQDTASIAAAIDRSRSWDELPNRSAARERLKVLICPAKPADATFDHTLAPTQYVGNGGVGPGAAALRLNPGEPPVAPPRAGCFRYDQKTPYASITDGLSYSILFLELSADPGPWIQGGPSTVRTLDVGASAKPPLGPGGQFGGNHPGGGNYGFADGSVRFLTDRTDPKVLEGLLTIAGGDRDPLPGE